MRGPKLSAPCEKFPDGEPRRTSPAWPGMLAHHVQPPEAVPDSTLRFFFEPRTVAVIGAGRRRGGVGAEIFHSLAACGFRGRAIPVNPNARDVEGVRAFASVSDVPGS